MILYKCTGSDHFVAVDPCPPGRGVVPSGVSFPQHTFPGSQSPHHLTGVQDPGEHASPGPFQS